MSFSNGWILEFALNKPMNTDTHLLLNTAKTTGPGATVAKAIRALLRTLFQLNGVLILLVILALTACASWLTAHQDRKSTRLNSSHVAISYAVFCLKKTNYDERGHYDQMARGRYEYTFR